MRHETGLLETEHTRITAEQRREADRQRLVELAARLRAQVGR